MPVSPSAIARVTGIDVNFKNLRGGTTAFLPQRIAVVGQGNTVAVYSTDKRTVTSAQEVAETYGFGSPLHLAVLQLLPINGNGVGLIPVTVYPLDDDGGAAASAGDITPTGTTTTSATWLIKFNNISVSVTIDSDVAAAAIATAFVEAINAELNVPVTAVDNTGVAEITSKWKGESANDIVIEIDGPTDVGVTFAITQPTSGATNPDVDDALTQMGNVWETMLISCLNISDTASLDKYQSFGDGRWGVTVHKPLVVTTGNTATSVAAAIAVPDARKFDKVNSQCVAPGSNDLPFTVAARQTAFRAIVANTNPAKEYSGQLATGITLGSDGDQWDYAERNAAVIGGSSTIETSDGVAILSDSVTFYHPDGDPVPAYRYVATIVKLQNLIFNVAVAFNSPNWAGAPLIPDNQPTVNPDARKPKDARAQLASLIDNFGLNALISDPGTAKESITANISSSNPNRLDLAFTVQVSGNNIITSTDLGFGFFFGTASVL